MARRIWQPTQRRPSHLVIRHRPLSEAFGRLKRAQSRGSGLSACDGDVRGAEDGTTLSLLEPHGAETSGFVPPSPPPLKPTFTQRNP